MNQGRFLWGATLVTAAGIALGSPQTPQRHEEAPGGSMPMHMAGPDMGMGIMAGPLHQVVMTSFLLPELQADLGLSPQQVTQLRQMKQEMLAKGKEISGQIAAKDKELDALLIPGTSKGEHVKKLLEQIAELRAQRLYLGYETAGQMKIALTEAQRAKLAAIKTGELHRAMMSRMTMSDMMQMMQFMGGEGMMISRMVMGGMMGQAMMGPAMTGHAVTGEGMTGMVPRQ
jgi:hypothetical protein